MADTSNYRKRVFINCPFDARYKRMLYAITFVVLDCGFIPTCALVRSDGAEERYMRIVELIRSCRFGVHDISRTSLDSRNRLPRFNMPFELGLFLGMNECRTRGSEGRVALIMDKERYRYQKFLSDLAGRDPRSHGGKVETACRVVRDWLRDHTDEMLPSGSRMWVRYEAFRRQLPTQCAELNLVPAELTYNEYCTLAANWIRRFAT